MRDRIILGLLLALVLVGMGWFGGGLVGFALGLAIAWIVGAVTGEDAFALAYLSSLVVGALMAVALPAVAFYRYRTRSN